jgi:ABC-2 type transport system permease protein
MEGEIAMKFFRQIKFEILHILKSRFLLVIGVLVMISAIALPVITMVAENRRQQDRDGIVRPMPIMVEDKYIGIPEPGWGGNEPIIVDGVTIQPDNPFYWNISSLQQEMASMEKQRDMFSTPEVLDIVLELMNSEIGFYLNFARHITNYADYRMELAMHGVESIYDNFFYENYEMNTERLLEAAGFRRGYDPELFRSKFINITPEERLAALDKLDVTLSTLYAIAENNDFPKFIEMRIQQEKGVINGLQEQIASQEQEIIRNPAQEEFINEYIQEMRKQIAMIEGTRIPLLQLRLERNIIPGENSWQNYALSDIEHSENQLAQTTIMTEDKFFQEPWMVQQYGSYLRYVETTQQQIDELNTAIIIGRNSIDSDMPDMKFVQSGARNRTVQFLNYSVFVALFAVLLGGWQMASEFQQGTIRLLMIRPRTRFKILMAKFAAAFLICLGIYTVGSTLNLITNGICFGFGDFAFPNYTIAGQSGFFAFYIPKFLASSVTIIFAYTIAFMLSVIAKNTAVAIALPIAGFIGSNIVMAAFSWRGEANWLAYTPIPFIQVANFFVQYSPVQQLIRRGIPISLTYGIFLLLTLSILFTLFTLWIFSKRDITN